MFRKLKLYFNTLKYLKTKQLYYQLKRKLIRNSFKYKKIFSIDRYKPSKIQIDELDLDTMYLSRFNTENLLNNHIELLNEEYNLDLNNWNNPKASHLWNFNLHYLEYLIALAADYRSSNDVRYYNKFKEILNSWIENNKEFKGDAWETYTISLRIPNLFICFDLFGKIFDIDKEFKSQVLESIFIQYQYLLQNQELHLLGNHYFENLKTIIICSLYFDEEDVYQKFFLILKKEINEQILDDGLHYELSLMYHKIILEDIIRIIVCIQQRKPNDIIFLTQIVQKMVGVLVSLEQGMGKIPLFNDAGDGVAKETHQLLNASKKLFNIEPIYMTNFPLSGYHKIYNNNIAIMFDTGRLGPKYMSGHGHCDALSFELSIDNKPIFVNSGTYQYQGKLREFFRSTEAHNTVMIGNQQQSEYWDKHRVGRRIRNIVFKKTENGILGSYENYLGNYHQREMLFENNKKLIIKDQVCVKKEQTIRSYLHLAPHLIVEKKDKVFVVKDKKENQSICTISYSGVKDVVIHKEGVLSFYSRAFGVLEKKNVLEFLWNSSRKHTEIFIDIL